MVRYYSILLYIYIYIYWCAPQFGKREWGAALPRQTQSILYCMICWSWVCVKCNQHKHNDSFAPPGHFISLTVAQHSAQHQLSISKRLRGANTNVQKGLLEYLGALRQSRSGPNWPTKTLRATGPQVHSISPVWSLYKPNTHSCWCASSEAQHCKQ